MRNVFAGLVVVGLFCGVTLGQNPPRDNQGAQAAPGQAVQPGQQIQPGRAVPGQAVPTQPGQTVRPGVGQPLQPAQPLQGIQRGASGDQEIACCVYGECKNEIEVAKFAESKAQNDEVREFAQRMVRDHSPGCQEMQQLAGQLASDSHQPQAASGGHLDWISIKKQIGQQCLKSIKEELGSKQGADFDHCFIGQQIGAHLKVIDELTVLRNHASSDLKQKLDKELEMAKQHLQLAKSIEQKLKDRPSERVSRRPEGSK